MGANPHAIYFGCVVSVASIENNMLVSPVRLAKKYGSFSKTSKHNVKRNHHTPGKLTWLWNITMLTKNHRTKQALFHIYVSLLEGFLGKSENIQVIKSPPTTRCAIRNCAGWCPQKLDVNVGFKTPMLVIICYNVINLRMVTIPQRGWWLGPWHWDAKKKTSNGRFFMGWFSS